MRGELKRLLRFGAIGAVNTAIDLLIFTLLTAWGWTYVPAQTVSFTCGVLNSFALNRRWTFRSGSSGAMAGRSEFIKFAGLNGLILLMTWGLIALFHQAAGLPVLVSKLLATGAGTLLNFTFSRLWVFGQKHTLEGAIDHEN